MASIKSSIDNIIIRLINTNLFIYLSTKVLPIRKGTPKIRCTTFEDNMRCIKLATNHNTRPRTKHLSIRLHHFRFRIIRKVISIEYINTKQQIADILTKPLPQKQFLVLCTKLMSGHNFTEILTCST